MSREDHDRLGTADLVAGADQREMHHEARQEMRDERAERPVPAQQQSQQHAMPNQQMAPNHVPPNQMPPQQVHPGAAEPLAALFPPQVAQDFRARWDQVQIGFVDDPSRAVQQADELVAQVMKSLAATFADQRSRLEAGLGRDADPNTEDLRVALRGYRSFFQRLLSL